MIRALYAIGFTYLGVCAFRLAIDTSSPLSHVAHEPAAAETVDSASLSGPAWFRRVKSWCNAVEVATRLRSFPPPETTSGVAHAAACYALAGQIDQARTLIDKLPLRERPAAATVLFRISHPIADAGTTSRPAR